MELCGKSDCLVTPVKLRSIFSVITDWL